MKHTPEPWKTDGETSVRASDHSIVIVPKHRRVPAARKQTELDLRRIVACVNSCEGITTFALDDTIIEQLLDTHRQLASGRVGGEQIPASVQELAQNRLDALTMTEPPEHS